ncbi:MAG: cupin-like domain-containing protein [Saprospiraceae bacterium]|nr:cupin-like domain-containing protein [Saprospiraceae bacterium]
MNLYPIEKVSGLNRDSFKENYLDPMKPVVFTDLINDWPAKDLWTFEYLKTNYGHLKVPIYDSSFSKAGKNYMSSTGTMKFGDYLDLIQREPTELRIFLWNIFKQAPELAQHIKIPNIMDGFYNEFPFMFFGGQGSYTRIHYDIDCSHVFLTQLQNRKRVLLFDQDQSKYLYHIPYTVACLVNPIELDEEKYPGIKQLIGYETILEHGETLFIPSMYWHHIEYTDGGFSLSLRASNSISLKAKGFYNIARHFVVDRGMNLILGNRWMDMKIKMAKRNAHLA